MGRFGRLYVFLVAFPGIIDGQGRDNHGRFGEASVFPGFDEHP